MDRRPDAAEARQGAASDDSPLALPAKKHRHLTVGASAQQGKVRISPQRSMDSAFSRSLEGLEIDAESSPRHTVELLKSKVTKLEKELYRRRISLSLRDQPSPPSPSTEAMSASDFLPISWKDEEIARLQAELSTLKLSKEQQESSHFHELSACLEASSRLKTELNLANSYKKQAEAARDLEREVKDLSERLELLREEGKCRDSEVVIIAKEKANLIDKVNLLENEVESEKQHSAQIQRTMAEAMKQLLASKAMCESDLSALQEQHLRLVTDSAKVEQNLRNQVSDLLQECRALKAKQEVPPECGELRRQLEAKEKEYETLSGKVATLEDKLIQISCQLAEERKRHFELQNVMSQDNEILKTEVEALQKERDCSTRELDSLRHSLELAKHRLQGESQLQTNFDSLHNLLQERECDIQRLLIALEEMKIKERHWDLQCAKEEKQAKEKADEERREEVEALNKVMREKIEAERTVFEEIEKRVKVEERAFMLECALKRSEEDNASLHLHISSLESELFHHSKSKHLSFQVESTDLASPLKTKSQRSGKLFQLNEITGEGTPHGVEARKLSFPESAKSPYAQHSKRSTKDSLSNSPCNCILW